MFYQKRGWWKLIPPYLHRETYIARKRKTYCPEGGKAEHFSDMLILLRAKSFVWGRIFNMPPPPAACSGPVQEKLYNLIRLNWPEIRCFFSQFCFSTVQLYASPPDVISCSSGGSAEHSFACLPRSKLHFQEVRTIY